MVASTWALLPLAFMIQMLSGFPAPGLALRKAISDPSGDHTGELAGFLELSSVGVPPMAGTTQIPLSA